MVITDMVIARVSSGIPGLDKLIEGGFPKCSNTLLLGSPGTGKTIFALQYLFEGAKKKENGVYISLESTSAELKSQAMEFGMDFDKLGDGKVLFVEVPLDRVSWNLFDQIRDAIKDVNASRLVFDSLQAFNSNIDMFSIPVTFFGGLALSDPNIDEEILKRKQDVKYKYERTPVSEGTDDNQLSLSTKNWSSQVSHQRLTYLLLRQMKNLDTTNLIATYSNGDLKSLDEVSEYAVDGLIKFGINDMLGTRTLRVEKMRQTKHPLNKLNVQIGASGIELMQKTD